MKSFMAALRSLVLPYGATSGTRIILDGVTGLIKLYNSGGQLSGQIGVTGGISGSPGIFFGTNLADVNSDYVGLATGFPGAVTAYGGLGLSPGRINFNTYEFPAMVASLVRGATQALSQGTLLLRSPQDSVQGGVNGVDAWFELRTNSHDATVAAQIIASTGVDLTGEDWTGVTYVGAPGWADRVGNFPPFRVKLVAGPARAVAVSGQMTPGATKGDNTIIATVPAKYRPVTEQTLRGRTAAGATGTLVVRPSGDILCFDCAAATVFQIDTPLYYLDS